MPHRLGLLSVVAVATLCLVVTPAAMAGDPATSIKINEVESDGSPVDFIELMNVSDTATDVGGLVLKDNNNSRTLTSAPGTTIPAGGFLAVDTEGVPNAFALGASDAARVFLQQADTTPIDSFNWFSHAE